MGTHEQKARYRSDELLTLGYERAMEWLEDAQSLDLRFQDVLNITRLHMDYLKAFDVSRDLTGERAWTEEDDAEFADMTKGIEAEEDTEEGSCEERSEDSEGEEA